MRFQTETGSTYEIHDGKVRRLPSEDSPDLRRDTEWLRLYVEPDLEVGKPAIMALEPLATDDSDVNVTIRTTSHVTIIEDCPFDFAHTRYWCGNQLCREG